MLTLAFSLAYVTRFDVLEGWPRPPVRETVVTLALVLVLFPVAYQQSRLYATNRVAHAHRGGVRALQGHHHRDAWCSSP